MLNMSINSLKKSTDPKHLNSSIQLKKILFIIIIIIIV